jgi:hypothetical protein
MVDAIRSTSRRQGRFREEWSGGSLKAYVRTDEQKSHDKAQSPGKLAQHNEAHRFRRQGKCGGGARTVHVLIRGDLSGTRQVGMVKMLIRNPEAPCLVTDRASRQKSAEGIVVLRDEGPNVEVSGGHP